MKPLWFLVGAYLCAAFLTLAYWHHQDWNFQTGDEPHYMIMASGIARHATFEQTLPYQDDIREHRFWGGWAPTDSPANNGHTVRGPHGLFNVHGVGLPLLLALPVLLGGAGGAKIFLVLLGSLVVVVAWKIAGLFFEEGTARGWAVAAVTIGLPLLVAANQVYTEIPAGLLCLTALYWLLTCERDRPFAKELCFALAFAYLPWLHMKLAAAAAILAVGIGIAMLRHGRPAVRVALPFAACAVSAGLLIFYNSYAFGNILGPYTGGEFQLSKTALVVSLGLLFDQNQGLFMQNPIQFVGLFALASFFAYNPFAATVWFLLLVDLLLANGTYAAAWFGGWSFVGRFEWTAALVFSIPTLLGLARLWNARRFFIAICAASFALQLHFYTNYTFRNVVLINKWGIALPYPLPPANDYSPFYGRAEWLVPAFSNPAWAFHYLPNLVFPAFALALLILGVRAARPERRAAVT